MTAADRARGSVLRYLAVLAAAAMTMSLLPLADTASAQEEPDAIDPTDACPDDPPPAAYEDRDEVPDVHVRNVDCVTEHGIALGFADNTYRPRLSVRRDQMASFIARTILEAGHELPPATAHPGFVDTIGNEHEDNIRRLAAAGIVLGGPEELPPTHYGPAKRVRRDQMASFLIRAAEHAFDDEFGSTEQQFTDVPASNVHFENVNAAAELGLALGGPGGLPATQFGPELQTRRDQMASFLARLLAFLQGEPPERVEAQTLALTPQRETNTVGTDHTVTATVEGAEGAAIHPQVDVRFEVYRDPVVAGDDTTGLGAAVETATVTTTAGTATFSYQGPAEPAEDLIVACVVDDADPGCDFTAVVVGEEVVVQFGEGEVGDAARKTWAEAPAVAEEVVLAPDSGPPGETVTATFTGDVDRIETVAIAGDCVTDATLFDADTDDAFEGGTAQVTFTIDDTAPLGTCELTFTVGFDDDSVQDLEATFEVQTV